MGHEEEAKGLKTTRSIQNVTIDFLTQVQRFSAPLISAFLLIHLAAPIAANFGGSALSTKVMLLGREYYQSQYTESLLIYGPLVIHVATGVTRRILLWRRRVQQQTNSPSNSWANIYRSKAVTLTAYAAYVLTGFHWATHRLNPSITTPPISSYSPSELDYEYVKYGLNNYPFLSWTLYGSLVGITLWHTVEGATIMWRSWTSKSRAPINAVPSSWTAQRRKWLAVTLAAPVLLGIWCLNQEPPMISRRLSQRLSAIFVENYGF